MLKHQSHPTYRGCPIPMLSLPQGMFTVQSLPQQAQNLGWTPSLLRILVCGTQQHQGNTQITMGGGISDPPVLLYIKGGLLYLALNWKISRRYWIGECNMLWAWYLDSYYLPPGIENSAEVLDWSAYQAAAAAAAAPRLRLNISVAIYPRLSKLKIWKLW